MDGAAQGVSAVPIVDYIFWPVGDADILCPISDILDPLLDIPGLFGDSLGPLPDILDPLSDIQGPLSDIIAPLPYILGPLSDIGGPLPDS